MKKYSIILLATLAIILGIGQAQAVVSTSTKETAKENREEMKKDKIKSKADMLLDNRIDGLNKLKERVSQMKNLSDADQTSITTIVNNVINDLTSLRTSIDNATSTEATKALRESITKKYRVYALVMPQINIIAAADRMTTSVSMMNIVAAKIETRINLATTSELSSANISLASKTLVDLKSKLAKAQAEAQEAVTLVSSLNADDGDKAVADSNQKALKDARAKIKSAQSNLVGAKKDAESIVKILGKEKKKVMKIDNATNSTSTAK